MIRTALLAALAIASSSAVLVSGCKKKGAPPEPQVLELDRMSGFRAKMCACEDQTCAATVQEQMNVWFKERMAATKAALNPPRTSAAITKKMTEEEQQYGECLTKATKTEASPVVDAAVPADAAPPVDAAPLDVPPPPSNPNDATRALREANIWAREKYRSAVGRVVAKYVDQEGLLDAEDGMLELTFGFDRSDDPKRRTGAPVKEPTFAEQCFGLTLTKGTWTRRKDISCGKTLRAPTCSLAEVWKRAVAANAPTDAVAVITYNDFSGKVSWFFSIKDSARGVDFKLIVPDDCPIEVEK